MEHMGVYITDSQNKTVELPVAPSDFTLKVELDGSTETVLGLGEVNILGKAKLQQAQIESTLPIDMENAQWATCEDKLDAATDYIKFLQAAEDVQKPVRLVLSGTDMNLQAQITSFESGFKGGNSIEYAYTLVLTEYRNPAAKKLAAPKQTAAKKTAPKQGKQRPAPAKKIGIGSTVIVNGVLHLDSYGTGPGQTEHNATRKISNIAQGRKCPYHVTMPDGGWRGWVTAGSVKLK